MTTDVSLGKTQEKINFKLASNTHQVTFRDIRDLGYIRMYPNAFSSTLPVYIRADLSRAIASLEDISSGKTKYFVYADLDMPPIPQQEIFDNETLEMLNTYGLIMARPQSGFPNFENGFFIISNLNPYMVEAVETGIVKYNLLNSIRFLEGKICRRDGWGDGTCVYKAYSTMFEYFYALFFNVEFSVEGRNGVVVFKKSEDEHIQDFIYFQGNFPPDIRKKAFRSLLKINVPTKTVNIPALSYRYNTTDAGNHLNEFRE